MFCFCFVCCSLSELVWQSWQKEQVELEAVKEEIADVKREIDEVKARVKLLENKAELSEREEEELRQKRPYLTALLAKDVELRKEKARFEERLQQTRQAAGNLFLVLFCFVFFFFFFFVSCL